MRMMEMEVDGWRNGNERYWDTETDRKSVRL